jgi:phosphoribosyl 1,2-cyclic phosphodiesterase
MGLLVASLNSGSNGNCYYIGSSSEAVLVDAGISCRETEKRLKRLGLEIEKVKAIFISHEHSDHIRGVERLSKKYKLPVYITKPTLSNSGLALERACVRSFSAYVPVVLNELSVLPFPKFHDAADPHSFIVEGNGVRIGVFTDIGTACKDVISNFKKCHAVFLESNYDNDMLEKGRYPHFLKARIRGDQGHLSNDQALELFREHKPRHLSHLILSHLSENNNSPRIVKKLFGDNAENTTVVVASREKESAAFFINGKSGSGSRTTVQMQLFS